jgi:hypothetical protein
MRKTPNIFLSKNIDTSFMEQFFNILFFKDRNIPLEINN